MSLVYYETIELGAENFHIPEILSHTVKIFLFKLAQGFPFKSTRDFLAGVFLTRDGENC